MQNAIEKIWQVFVKFIMMTLGKKWEMDYRMKDLDSDSDSVHFMQSNYVSFLLYITVTIDVLYFI